MITAFLFPFPLYPQSPTPTAAAQEQYSFHKDGLTVLVTFERKREGHWFNVLITDRAGKDLYAHEGISDAEDVTARFLDVNGDGLLDVVLEYSYEDVTTSPMILVNDANQRFVDANPKNFPLDIQGLDDGDKDAGEKDGAHKKELFWVKAAGKKAELVFKNLMFFDQKSNSYTIDRNVALAYNPKTMCFEAPPKYLKFIQGQGK